MRQGKHFGAHFGLCLLRTLPFLADPGTGFPIKNDLPTLRKRSTNCVAHAKQEKNSDLQDRVQWGFVFVTPIYFFRFIGGCLENSDLENSDLRPEKLRPSGVSKTQTSKKLRPSGVSKTQTRKTQTLGCLENSDPKNSDPLSVSKTQTRKIKHIYTA